uniref:Protein YIP n=1 Tax=Kalanchoe fedtschenkoi TaxID=63787 RepID=A0A7N0T5X2_KALFE
MDDNYATLPTSHLLGSVPAAVSEEKNAGTYEVPGSSMQTFPPNSGGDRSRSGQGYHTYDSPHEGGEPESSSNWKGFFSISSYTQYFNVDTDVVLNRLLSSLYPHTSDFFSKIDANPDLYGLIWISTTLVFVLASLGNCATYLMDKRTDSSTSWSFDVSYVNWAAGSIYGYVILVPLAFYFLLQYLGSNTSLIRFWCLWGYSLFIFILSSFLLVIPVEFLRWIIIIATGVASSSFVSLNLKSYIEGTDVALVLVASFVLQMALAVFIKMSFFP